MRIRTFIILCITLGFTSRCQAQQAPTHDANEIIARLMDRNSQRERLQAGYTGTRRYVLENQKFNKRAEMLVSVKCDPDGTKHFEVVSEDGWHSANKRVLRKMLDSETETSRPQIRLATGLTPENYQFQILGNDSLDGRSTYVVQVVPQREDKYLFEGRVWVDTEDFAVVQVEGKPAKNPSFWTRSVHFVQQYHKSGPFWFPFLTESVTEARIFGKTEVTIKYFDYQPNSSAVSPLSAKSLSDQIEANYANK